MSSRTSSIAWLSSLVLLATTTVDAQESYAPATANRLDTYLASERSFAAAVGAHRRHQLDSASGGYEEALTRDPEFVEAVVNLARIDIEQGRFESAAKRLQEALSDRPEYPAIYRVRGLLELRTGNIPSAIEDFSYARSLGPDDAELLVNLGAALLIRGRLVEAEKTLLKAIQIESDNAEALLNLALAQDRAGRQFYAATTYRLFLQMAALDDVDRAVVLKRLDEIDAHFAPLITKEPIGPSKLAATKSRK